MAGPDLEINIKTKADVKALRDLEASLKSQISSLKKLGQDASSAEAQLKKVQAALKGAPTSGLTAVADRLRSLKEQGNAAAGAISGLAGLISAPIAAGVAIVGALAASFRSVTAAVQEYAQAEESVTRMDAALAQQGQLTDENREKYQGLASELQKLTGIADDEWAGVLARLTQFGSDPASIGMDADAVKNLAGILGGDLQTAALAIGKAIQGNFSAFSRWGIVVDENASQAKKLNQLYNELAQRGGGQLEARSRTLAGQWQATKNAGGDLMEALGGLIARSGVLQSITGGLANVFESWSEILGGTIPVVEGLTNAQRKTVDVQEQLDSSGRRYERRLEAMRLEADQLADALARVRSEGEANQRRQDERNSGRMALELAIIDEQEKRGILSGPSASARRAGVREKYALLKEKTALENDLKQIQANADELKLAEMRRQQTKVELQALEARKAAALRFSKTAAGKLDGLIADLEGQLGELQKDREAVTVSDYANDPGKLVELNRTIQKRQAQLEEFRRRRETVGGSPEDMAVVDAEIERTRRRLAEDEATAEKLGRTVPDANRQIQEDANVRKDVRGFGAAASRVQGNDPLSLAAAAAAASNEKANSSVIAAFQKMIADNGRLEREVQNLSAQVRHADR